MLLLDTVSVVKYRYLLDINRKVLILLYNVIMKFKFYYYYLYCSPCLLEKLSVDCRKKGFVVLYCPEHYLFSRDQNSTFMMMWAVPKIADLCKS